MSELSPDTAETLEHWDQLFRAQGIDDPYKLYCQLERTLGRPLTTLAGQILAKTDNRDHLAGFLALVAQIKGETPLPGIEPIELLDAFRQAIALLARLKKQSEPPFA
jgi:hypothetical protein